MTNLIKFLVSAMFMAIIVGSLVLATAAEISVEDVKKIEVPIMSNYFVFLYKHGRGWIDGKPAFDQPLINGHFEHMSKLENEGKLVIGGPFKDESGIMGILKVPSLEEALKLISDDPIIQNNILEAEVKAWEPAVTGCIGSEGE